MIVILCLLLCSAGLSAKVMLIDKIDTVVCGVEENAPLTFTDVEWKRSLTGAPISLDQQVQMEIVRQQVKHDQMPVDDSYAVKYLESIKSANGLTQNDLIDLFAEVGLLYAEGKAQLVTQYTYDMFLHHKFRSQVLVTDDEVQEFHEKNPEIEPGVLEIKIATVSYDSDTKEAVSKKIDALVGGDNTSLSVEWGDVIEMEDSDLSADKKFISSMREGSMHAVDNGVEFDVYHLIRKKDAYERSLNECRPGIIDHLSKQQFEILLQDYNDNLQDKVRLVHPD